MMMFQTFTTLAALLLFASNAALAAPQYEGGLRPSIREESGPVENRGVDA